MTTEERESKSPQWRTDNLGKNVGLANVAQRRWVWSRFFTDLKHKIINLKIN